MMAKPADEEGYIGITIAEIDSCLKDLIAKIGTNSQPFQGKELLGSPECHLNASFDTDCSQIEDKSYQTLRYHNSVPVRSSATEAINGCTFVAEKPEHDEHITEFRSRCDALYSSKLKDDAEHSFPVLSSLSNTLGRDSSQRYSGSNQNNAETMPPTNIAAQTNMVERGSSLELTEFNSPNVTILPSMVSTKQETREQKLRPRCDAIYSPKLKDKRKSFPMFSSRSNTLKRDNRLASCSESNQNNAEIRLPSNIATQRNMVEWENGPELTESNSNVTILPSKVATNQETRKQELRPRCDAIYSPKLKDKRKSFQMFSSRSNTLKRDNRPASCSESNQNNAEIRLPSNIATQTNMAEWENGPELTESTSNVTTLPLKVATEQETREQEHRPRCDAYSPTRLRRFNQDNEDSFQIPSTQLNVVERDSDNSSECSESNRDNVEITPSNMATQTKMVEKKSSPRVFDDNQKNDKISSPQNAQVAATQRNVAERDDSPEWSQSNQNNVKISSLTVPIKPPQSGKREKLRPRSELIRTYTTFPNSMGLKYAHCSEKTKTWGKNSKVLIFTNSAGHYRRKSTP